MKKIALFITLITGAVTLQSCTVEEAYTEEYVSSVYELTTTFSEGNQYNTIYDFTRPLYDSDHVLIYRLWATQDGDVWRLITNTIFFNNGDEILYNYDHTKYDFSIFLEPNFPLNTLTANERSLYLNNQTFRVVIIPGAFAGRTDFSDYDATIKFLGLQNEPIKKIKSKLFFFKHPLFFWGCCFVKAFFL